MRFNYDAYSKVFPKKEPEEKIDSAVEGYTPTADDKGKETPPEKVAEENDIAAKKDTSEAGAAPAQPEKAQPEGSQEDISQK